MRLNKIQQYLLDCVNTADYVVQANTDQEKINFLSKTINIEKADYIKQTGLVNACEDWLRGLAGACSIEYWDQGATELLLKWGYSKRYAENIDNYWKLTARNLAQLVQKSESI